MSLVTPLNLNGRKIPLIEGLKTRKKEKCLHQYTFEIASILHASSMHFMVAEHQKILSYSLSEKIIYNP
jgi:hypothetical protein